MNGDRTPFRSYGGYNLREQWLILTSSSMYDQILTRISMVILYLPQLSTH